MAHVRKKQVRFRNDRGTPPRLSLLAFVRLVHAQGLSGRQIEGQLWGLIVGAWKEQPDSRALLAHLVPVVSCKGGTREVLGAWRRDASHLRLFQSVLQTSLF